MSLTVSICTDDPQTFLILNHIVSVAGYKPQFMELDDTPCSDTAELPYAILFDTNENTEPILALSTSLKRNSFTKNIILVALTKPCNTPNFLSFLQAGIDECFPHPFTPEHILSFLKDRRPIRKNIHQSDVTFPTNVEFGNLDIVAKERVLRQGSSKVHLTPIQFRLLQGFASTPGEVISREHLIKIGWPDSQHVQPRTVDVHVGNLRRQLRKLTGKNLIRAVHTTGYAFDLLQ